ncbi:MAG TPA: hypothetical protein VFU22_23030, partial [Roseiflexaceae bacterium]|nr:hypothetical protein [Roseiflexaceae bacterium]
MRRFALARAAALVLLVALAAPLAAAPRATPRQTLILRVYFRSAAERDRLLAQLDVPDHGVQPEGYLFAYGDQAT